MRTLGVVCARKNSQRLPGKHWLTLGGQPIVEGVIRAALAADFLHGVVVSTDDERIRPVVEKLGGEPQTLLGRRLLFRDRPAELATNEAPIEGVLLDALDFAEKNAELSFEAVVFLPGNIVFLEPEQIDACVKMLDRCPEATAAMTVRQAKEPPEWMWAMNLDGVLSRTFAGPTGVYRMQDIPKRFLATGAVNVVRAKTLRENQGGGAFKWLGDKILGVIDDQTLEIHTAEDYDYAVWKWGSK